MRPFASALPATGRCSTVGRASAASSPITARHTRSNVPRSSAPGTRKFDSPTSCPAYIKRGTSGGCGNRMRLPSGASSMPRCSIAGPRVPPHPARTMRLATTARAARIFVFTPVSLRLRMLPAPRPGSLVAAVDPALQAGPARVAQVAAFRAPGDVAVVAHAAEPAFDDIAHAHVVRARAHLESQFLMAHLAAEPDAVEPVREHDRAHAALVGIAVEQYVAILRARQGRDARERGNQQERCAQRARARHGPWARQRAAPAAFGGVRGVLWQRAHSVSGKATAPWHWPHCSPCRMRSIEI